MKRKKLSKAIKRPPRPRMSREGAVAAFERFSKLVLRSAETADPVMFGVLNAQRTNFELPRGSINLVFQLKGDFGVSEDLFRAIKTLSGRKLPCKRPSKALPP